MNQTFDINRSLALLKLNLNLNKKTMLLAIAGFFGFVFITSFFVARYAPLMMNKIHLVFYFIFLYGGVALIAGNAFRNLNSSEKSIAYLSLPASTFEKYLIPWLLSGIIWAIVSIVSYAAFAQLINGLWSGVMAFPFKIFNPFYARLGSASIIDSYMPYFLVHSIFFLGAAAFRRNAIPKTLLAGFIIQSGYTFINLFGMLILFGNIQNMDLGSMDAAHNYNPTLTHFFSNVLPYLVKYIFVYVIPVVFYTAAFFKLKEREA